MVFGLVFLLWPFFLEVAVLSEGTVLCLVTTLPLDFTLDPPAPELCWEDPWPPPCFEWDELVVVVVVGVVDVVVVVVVGVVVGVHEAWTFLTGPVPGGTRLEAGVPAGALTSKVSTWPVTSVTVTLHWSAEAVGSAAIAMVAIAEPAEMARTFSFRRTDISGLTSSRRNGRDAVLRRLNPDANDCSGGLQ